MLVNDIPLHVLEAHVFPHLPVDTRRAFGVYGRIDLTAFAGVKAHLAKRPKAKRAGGLSYWYADFRIPCARGLNLYTYSYDEIWNPTRELRTYSFGDDDTDDSVESFAY